MIVTQATSLKMHSQCNLIRIQVYTCIPLMAVIAWQLDFHLHVAVQSLSITTNVARSNSTQVYLIPHQMLKVVSDLRRQVVFFGYSGFLHYKTDLHDITEILLKLSLNTINKTKPFVNRLDWRYLFSVANLRCKPKM